MLVSRKGSALYCERGNFYIDPTFSVENAVVTHAHSDHLSPNSINNYCSTRTAKLMRLRLNRPNVVPFEYGESFEINGVRVSLHPAGHILGSSQVRIESEGEVVVVTGDYNRAADSSCEPFEVVNCNMLISEATFAMPHYRWPDPLREAGKILEWSDGKAVLFCYSLGKSQQVISLLNSLGYNDIYVHPLIAKINQIYLDEGFELDYKIMGSEARGITILPSGAKFNENVRTASVSGWNILRKNHGYSDAAFTISGHADWDSILKTAEDSAASKIYFHHGRTDLVCRYLNERGYETESI